MFNKNQLLALAAFITSIANDGEGGTTTEYPPADPPTGKRKRGTPPASPAGETPAAPAAAEPPAPAGKPSTEEVEANYQKLRAVIEPFVKGTWTKPPVPKGPEVKKIIKSFTPGDWPADQEFTLKELAAFPASHATFERDISALEY